MMITYRKANYNDINIVTDLLCLLYEWLDMPREELLEENKQLLTDSKQVFFIAFDGEKPVGISHGSIRYEYVNGANDEPVGYLEAIYILPGYRGNRIATELVKVIEHWAGYHGCHEFAGDCLLDNTDSYNFHLKYGFKETERCIFFLKTLKPVKYEIHYD